MRLNHDLISWESPLNKFLAIELCEDNEQINKFPPSVEAPMDGEHGRNDTGADTRVLVTGMENRWPRQKLSDAVFAGMFSAIEGSGWTEQPRVMERLYHRHARFTTGVVDGRRYYRKGIMDMDDMGFSILEQR